MCTYATAKIPVHGSGKGPSGWFELTDATVYVDHPAHFPAEHTLNVDFLNPAQGPGARVAVELTEKSARALADAILAALDRSAPSTRGAPTNWRRRPPGEGASGEGRDQRRCGRLR